MVYQPEQSQARQKAGQTDCRADGTEERMNAARPGATHEADETNRGRDLEQAAIGAAIADLQGKVVRVNPAGCSLLGRPEEQLIGWGWTDTTPPDEVPLAQAMRGLVELR